MKCTRIIIAGDLMPMPCNYELFSYTGNQKVKCIGGVVDAEEAMFKSAGKVYTCTVSSEGYKFSSVGPTPLVLVNSSPVSLEFTSRKLEKIEAFREKGADVDFGAFGENLIIEGFDFRNLPVGTRFAIGDALLEMTQIGKECHSHCAIFHMVGDCIMPREGVFASSERF